MSEVGLKENGKYSGGSVEILSSLKGCATYRIVKLALSLLD